MAARLDPMVAGLNEGPRAAPEKLTDTYARKSRDRRALRSFDSGCHGVRTRCGGMFDKGTALLTVLTSKSPQLGPRRERSRRITVRGDHVRELSV